jgi:hypothetical protein
MANMIRSPGFGPAYWKNPNSLPTSMPMSMTWDNISEFEIVEANTFNVNMNIGAANGGVKTRGWDYAVTIENNTDPTNVTIASGTGTLNAAGSTTFTVSFPTSAFLATTNMSVPSLTELENKFGPIRAGDSNPNKYSSLLRSFDKQPTAYRNVLVEEIVDNVGVSLPSIFDSFNPQYNKYAIVFKIVRSNATAPAFSLTDYRVLIVKFAPLIDIE